MVDQQPRRVAVITGAGGMRGIGRAIAMRLARDGFDLALLDVKRDPAFLPPAEVEAGWRGVESVADEIRALGRRALAIYADITDPDQVEAAAGQTVRELGGLDALVNNARAILGRDFVPVVELDPGDWERVMAVNARGTFLCAQAAARCMIERQTAGKIVNIASIAGKRGEPGSAAYSASKFAVIGFTQSLAQELAPYRINVNAICPGTTDSGRFKLAELEAAAARGQSLAEFQRQRYVQFGRGVPLGRVAVPDDIANMAAFLLSSQADYITGQSINVDGGQIFH